MSKGSKVLFMIHEVKRKDDTCPIIADLGEVF